MNIKPREDEGRYAFLLRQFLMASTAAMFAETVTLPLDTIKVRLQIQKQIAGQEPRYKGFAGTLKTIVAEEGVLALFNGLMPGLQRQFLFAGLRIGLYVPVRNFYSGDLQPGQNPTLLQKILAGMTTGAIAITVANPTDVVKVRMQVQGQLAAESRPFSGPLDCYRKTIAKDGIRGLWIGWGPNVARNSVISAAEIAAYDQYKQILTQDFGWSDLPHTHMLCGLLAGFNATVVGSPGDVITTRLMNKTPGQAETLFALVPEIYHREGFSAFYKGFWANFMRIGGFNVAMFVSLEQVIRLYNNFHRDHHQSASTVSVSNDEQSSANKVSS